MKTALIITVGLIATMAPAMAHHSFAAEYDNSKPVTLNGICTKVEWLNPHAKVYLDVKDDSGKVSTWEVELGSPNGLMRSGWTRNSLKPGDPIVVEGAKAKDGSNLANAKTIKFADGRKLFAGTPSETGSEK
jgi:hypothetical protein